jgi:hypothetical protein
LAQRASVGSTEASNDRLPRVGVMSAIRAVSPAHQARVEKAWLSLRGILRSLLSDSDIECAQAFAWPSDVS